MKHLSRKQEQELYYLKSLDFEHCDCVEEGVTQLQKDYGSITLGAEFSISGVNEYWMHFADETTTDVKRLQKRELLMLTDILD